MVAAALLLAPGAAAVDIDWVAVGNPGNAPDTTVMICCLQAPPSVGTSGYGGVVYSYFIAKHEVTNAQYAAFLNAVAATDTNALYNPYMFSDASGGITKSGVSGSFSYSVKTGFANKPVNFVSFWDALRFANWLNNGQPSGAQGSGTTEDGAYKITAGGIAANSITRKAGATIFLSSENEWYKAAYYSPVSSSYFLYPAGTSTPTTCDYWVGSPANTANCNYINGFVTDVGAYTSSASPYGTFDQGGNVWEWNEVIIGSYRGARGGSFIDVRDFLAASVRSGIYPEYENYDTGFRVTRIVAAPALVPIGDVAWPAIAALLVITGLVELAHRQRRQGRAA